MNTLERMLKFLTILCVHSTTKIEIELSRIMKLLKYEY